MLRFAPAKQMQRQLQQAWAFFTELVREDAYERYREHHRLFHADETPLDRRAFYLAEQERKWNGVRRCC